MRESLFTKAPDEIIADLRRIPSFKIVSDEQLGFIAQYARIRKYDADERIIEQGTFDAWIYFLINGELGIIYEGVEISRLRRLGDIFGEMSIIDAQPRSCDVVARTDAITLAVDGSCLDRMETESHAVLHAVLFRIFAEVLAERLRRVDADLATCKQTVTEINTTCKLSTSPSASSSATSSATPVANLLFPKVDK